MDDEIARRLRDLEREVQRLRGRGETERHDPYRFRRTLLLRARRAYYPACSRSGAAKAIAADWTAYAQERGTRDAREGVEVILEELMQRGCKPLTWRTIDRLFECH